MSSQAYLSASKKPFLYRQMRWKKWEERAFPKEWGRDSHNNLSSSLSQGEYLSNVVLEGSDKGERQEKIV